MKSDFNVMTLKREHIAQELSSVLFILYQIFLLILEDSALEDVFHSDESVFYSVE